MNDPGSYILNFGKFKGKTLDQIADEDRHYIAWLQGLDDLKPTTREAIDAFVARNSAEFDRDDG